MKYFLLLLLLSTNITATRGQSALVQTDTTSGWRVVFSKSGLRFNELQFPSRDTGFAIAWDNPIPSFAKKTILVRSTDQGKHWDSLTLPPFTSAAVPRYYFVSSLVGYCNSGLIDSSVIWKTIDGGLSWTEYPRNARADGAIGFANKDTGIVLGVGDFARTTDGGETWKRTGPQYALETPGAISFGDSRTAYAFGGLSLIPPHTQNTGSCEKTTDGGLNWMEVYTGVPEEIMCCQALDANTVVAGCSRKYAARTTNGGLTWDTVALGPSKTGLFAISFFGNQRGLLVGNDDNTGINSHGVIYATTDGGKTWEQELLPYAPGLYGVAMLNDSIALVCGGGNIYRTTTGGMASSVRNQPALDLSIHTYPNPTTGIVTIEYALATTESISIRYFDVHGKTIGSVSAQLQDAGTHRTLFDASKLTNGTYFFQVTTLRGGLANGAFEVQR